MSHRDTWYYCSLYGVGHLSLLKGSFIMYMFHVFGRIMKMCIELYVKNPHVLDSLRQVIYLPSNRTIRCVRVEMFLKSYLQVFFRYLVYSLFLFTLVICVC